MCFDLLASLIPRLSQSGPRRGYQVLLALALSLTPLTAPAEPLSFSQEPLHRYDLRALPWSNLFYQLDCLAEQGYCSAPAYRALWQTLGWTSADQRELKKWQALKQKYGQQISFPQSQGRFLPARFEGLTLWDKVRQASLNAIDRQSLNLNLSLVLLPNDSEALMAILDHFAPRFETWWLAEAQSLTQAASRSFAEQLQAQDLPQLIAQAAHFYQAELNPRSLLAFNFIARPALGGNNLNGEQVEAQSLIEVMGGRSPLSNLDVVVHELCHYLYRRASREQETRLLAAIAAQDNPEAVGAYNLLNEVLATAIGNGGVNAMQRSEAEFAAYLKTPGSFYNDPFIDPLAKAIYPRLQLALSRGETLYGPGFIKDYLQIAKQTLGSDLAQPRLLLRTMAAAYEPELKAVFRQLQHELRAGSVWGSQGLGAQAQNSFQSFAGLSGVIFVRRGQLQQLQSWGKLVPPADLARLKQSKQPLVYSLQRTAAARVYLFVADKPEQYPALIQRFVRQKKNFLGQMP